MLCVVGWLPTTRVGPFEGYFLLGCLIVVLNELEYFNKGDYLFFLIPVCVVIILLPLTPDQTGLTKVVAALRYLLNSLSTKFITVFIS